MFGLYLVIRNSFVGLWGDNVLQLPEGGEFEKLNCQLTMNLNRSIKPHNETEPPLLGRCCYALFFLGIKGCIAILIPKKKGIGYLKSPFGGHYAGAKYKEFCQLNLTYAGDAFDIDGYLSIGLGLNSWDDNYDAAVKEIMDGVVSLFTQCCGYKEIDSPTFWSHVK